MKAPTRSIGLLFALGLIGTACGSDKDSPNTASCSVEAQDCKDGLVCDNVEGGSPACFAPLTLRGRVVEASDPNVGIAGAVVVARDINGAIASRNRAQSDAEGFFELSIPATRSAEGSPRAPEVTLRADASGHATFPSGLRVALPVDTSSPEGAQDRWVIENASTEVALDALPNTKDLGTIEGFVRADGASGMLVVSGAHSALAGPDGAFTIFNVPSGNAEVHGYKAGLSVSSANAVVTAGSSVNVELTASSAPLGEVRGDVSFVNASEHQTSVVLVVASTFNATLARGEVPLGLRQFPVTNGYAFTGVPSGDYIVLAAFENDELVRDPDTSIGGTELQRAHVDGAEVSMSGFKITGALSVLAPGASGPEPISGKPILRWADDSSEDGYEVTVYDGFGNIVYENRDVPRVTGSAEVSLEYTGPALAPGYYQFRAVSYRLEKKNATTRTRISATEDLKGVFIVPR